MFLKSIGVHRSAMSIAETVNPRLKNPIGLLFRMWGPIILVTIIYLDWKDLLGANRNSINIWYLFFIINILLHEILRAFQLKKYDDLIPRHLRIISYSFFITWLIIISPKAMYVLGLIYIIPVFASIAFFYEDIKSIIVEWVLTTIGYAIGLFPFSTSLVQALRNFIFIEILLVIFGLIIWWVFKSAFEISVKLINLTVEIQNTFDINLFAKNALDLIEKLIAPKYSLIMGIDTVETDNPLYVTHKQKGCLLKQENQYDLLLTEYRTLFSKKCFDMNSQEFEQIFKKYFEGDFKSIKAELLFDSGNHILGCVIIAHDVPNYFTKYNLIIFKELSNLFAHGFEKCILYRKANLKIGDNQNGEFSHFIKLDNLDLDIIHKLVEELCESVGNVSGITIHSYDSKSTLLTPFLFFDNKKKIYKDQSEYILSNGNKDNLSFTRGIAGHSLQHREPIRVPNTYDHPLFVLAHQDNTIKSMMSFPLMDTVNNSPIGTISINSEKEEAFTLDDELKIYGIIQRSFLKIIQVKSSRLLLHNDNQYKNFFNETLNFENEEDVIQLCKKIVDSAVNILCFKSARIRLVDQIKKDLVTFAVAGIPEKDANNLLGNRMPLHALKRILEKCEKKADSYLLRHADSDLKGIINGYFYRVPGLEKQIGDDTWDEYDGFITPITSQTGELIGLLTLDLPENGRVPNDNEIEVVNNFARIISRVIELAKAKETLLGQQINAISLLEKIGIESSNTIGNSDISEVALSEGKKLLHSELTASKRAISISENVVFACRNATDSEGCSLYIVKGEEIELVNSTYLPPLFFGRRKQISTKAKCGLTSFVAATGEPILYNNKEYKNHRAWEGAENHILYLKSQDVSSLMIVPILSSKGNIVGVVSVENHKNVEGFKQNHLEILQELSKQISEIINVLRFEKLNMSNNQKLIEDNLHDLLGWYQSGVVHYLEIICKELQQGNFQNINDLLEVCKRAQTVGRDLKSLHSVINSKLFEAETLTKGLRIMINSWALWAYKEYDEEMKILLDCPHEIELPDPVKNTLLMLISNALTNSILHSGISQFPYIEILIKIEKIANKLQIIVQDNGVGIKNKLKEGYGLRRMRNLADELNNASIQTLLKIKDVDVGSGAEVIIEMDLQNISNSI